MAAIFRKSLRLTHESRKKFSFGKLMNMITTDANALQQICQQLHGLWSAPFRIVIAMVLLYQQLGVASIVGSIMLVLIIPLQASFDIIVPTLKWLVIKAMVFYDLTIAIDMNINFFFLEQTFVISKMRKLTKEGLQQTDRRVGLMNEILSAMDTVKYEHIKICPLSTFMYRLCLNIICDMLNMIQMLCMGNKLPV